MNAVRKSTKFKNLIFLKIIFYMNEKNRLFINFFDSCGIVPSQIDLVYEILFMNLQNIYTF